MSETVKARVRATVDVDYELSARGGCMPQPAVVAERLRQRLVDAVDNDGLLEQGTGVTASRYCVAAGEIADGQRVPGRPKTCVTHHHACDCREDFFAEATGVYRKLRRVTQLSDDELMTALKMSANEVHAFRLGLAQVLARDPEMETNYDDKE